MSEGARKCPPRAIRLELKEELGLSATVRKCPPSAIGLELVDEPGFSATVRNNPDGTWRTVADSYGQPYFLADTCRPLHTTLIPLVALA